MRLGHNAKVDLLKSVPLFAGCTKSELKQLASSTDEVDLREGYVLVREGRPGREFFVLVDGDVRGTFVRSAISPNQSPPARSAIFLSSTVTRTSPSTNTKNSRPGRPSRSRT